MLEHRITEPGCFDWVFPCLLADNTDGPDSFFTVREDASPDGLHWPVGKCNICYQT